ncbi:phosphotransferase family protein [Halorussus salinus]|uniref:phosphotransferase family protein n=1 Tax=Halorussus salinus TaxID=1364935 RepID=UPI00109293BC|nr:phosphotransferase [Halorussus salinus]
MFTSLGYVTELEEAAERGKSEIRSRMTVGEADVRRAVGRAFPDADSITIHGDPMAGAGGVTYVVSLGDPESKYVLKFAPEEAADHLRNGVAVYDYLNARTEVPVPSVRAIETEDTEVPYPYAIVEYVWGDELSSIEQFESFPRDRQRSIVREMGRVLGTLHAQTQFETYGALEGETTRDLTVKNGASDWRDYYRETYEEYATAADDSPVSDLVAEAYEYFEEASATVRPESGPVLLHADFTPDNLITEDGSVRAVLDWEHAKAGCSAREFWEVEENVVRIFQSDEVRDDFRAAFYGGYGEIEPTSETFLALKSLFAVGEFTRIETVRSVLAELTGELDAAEFRDRAERELDARIRDAETRLEELA